MGKEQEYKKTGQNHNCIDVVVFFYLITNYREIMNMTLFTSLINFAWSQCRDTNRDV